ncbi:hypothetical protein FRB95_014841 [Tulasnella sp. JGI-2019a]|nr:hypothetical protein FRB95_014841 [Tulasnella sp. JGI-2019a]
MFALRSILGSRPSVTTTGATHYYTPPSLSACEGQPELTSLRQNTIASIDSIVPPRIMEPAAPVTPVDLPSEEPEVSQALVLPIPQMIDQEQLAYPAKYTPSVQPEAQSDGDSTDLATAISQPQAGLASIIATSISEYPGGEHAEFAGDVKQQSDYPGNNNTARKSVLLSEDPGAFAQVSALSGPAPDPEVNTALREQATVAGTTLTHQEIATIVKVEGKDAKRFSKILKKEGKAETKLLAMAMKELSNLQKVVKTAISNEAAALKAHARAVKSEHKANKIYLDAKAKWEITTAELGVMTEKLDATHRHAQEQTALLKAQTREVEQLRTQKATDDRERQTKLSTPKDSAK